MLSVRNVTKKYGKTLALSDVSLEAAPGQVVLVVGGCGAGKSALLDCIAGVSAFDGSISVGGLGCRSFQARRLISYVRDPLLPSLSSVPGSGSIVCGKLSCDEHLAFIRRAYALDSDGVKYASSLVSSFGLDQYCYRPACELPASALRRLELVLALASRPSLLLLDRPSLGLDTVYAEELYSCLLALKLRGTAVVIAVSDVSEVCDIWDVGYELRGGRIVGSFVPDADDADDVFDDAEVGDQVQPDDVAPDAVSAAPDKTDVPVVPDKTVVSDQPDVSVASDKPVVPDKTDVSEDVPAAVIGGEAPAFEDAAVSGADGDAAADTDSGDGGVTAESEAVSDDAVSDAGEDDAEVSKEKPEKTEDAV